MGNENTEKRIIAITGPTASGKTGLAVRLAGDIGGEIISCDSMQIYKGMDIGTAKVTEEEKNGIPHHLIDVCLPGDSFSCADYRALAERAADEIISRGKTPIFCGGTGLYLDSVLRSGEFSPSVPDGIREELEKHTPDELYGMLVRVDPASAEAIHKNNVKRVIRALEIYMGTGVTKTEWDRRSLLAEKKYKPLIFVLEAENRDVLYDRINRRVDIMLENGLEAECKRLDLDRGLNSAQAIGYKEMYGYIDGFYSYEDAAELIKKNSRNYAKRQITWFSRYDAVRLKIDGNTDIYKTVLEKTKEFLGL